MLIFSKLSTLLSLTLLWEYAGVQSQKPHGTLAICKQGINRWSDIERGYDGSYSDIIFHDAIYWPATAPLKLGT
ncbi:hypothetical protein RchiOBHm_Chr4g0430561 [Rosa chinensis]|uniref:Uncharacterized protein n=1 Tax=Rosa chinensis TaxID=74649 RepID=A0A2P6R0I8_ROSCH|nr:hypothetical protein RchiOBHm_Chr4g0430561 [Rosa chinensis]